MSFLRPHLLVFALLCASPGAVLRAQNAQPSAAEAKLRESLRATMLQLRTSENDKALLQAAQAETDEKIKTLTAQVEAVSKQIAADKTAAEKATADLQEKIDARDKAIGELKESLGKEIAEYKKSVEFGVTKEGPEGQTRRDKRSELNRRVADQQTKNAAMFKIANEILSRYEKFGLGDALTSREPFTGITRVKLQSYFEEYQDKLADQRIKPTPPATPEPTVAPPPKTTPAPALKTTPAPKKSLKFKSASPDPNTRPPQP